MEAVFPSAFSLPELSNCIKACIGDEGGKYPDAKLHISTCSLAAIVVCLLCVSPFQHMGWKYDTYLW